MNEVKETLRGFYIGIGIYALVIEVIGLIFSGNRLAYTIGVLFGVIISIYLTIHLAKTIDRALELPQEPAIRHMQIQSVKRLFITLFVLTIGLMVEWINFIALVLGLFGRKAGALMAPTLLKKLYPEHYARRQNVRRIVKTEDTSEKEEDKKDSNEQ